MTTLTSPSTTLNYGRVLIAFQIAYGVGFLFAGRIIDKLGTKKGYALAILLWGCASISTSLVGSVVGFIFICRASFSGSANSGNFPAAIKATTDGSPPTSVPSPSASSTPAPTPQPSSPRCSSLQ